MPLVRSEEHLAFSSERLLPSAGLHELRQASVPTPAALEQNDKKAADQAKNEVPNSTREKARRRQKIDGMEFYEWAELIRSSSL